ncbi:MAG: hypothetical protein ACRBBQ_16555 [Cognatishimia sp.]
MKFITACAVVSFLATPALAASNAKICKGTDIAQKGRVTTSQCACMLKGADKYLSKSDKAYLVDFWSGKRNDKPHIYLARAYPPGKNKPLIKYSAYTAATCK